MIIATFMTYTFLSVATLTPATVMTVSKQPLQGATNVQHSVNVVQKPTYGPLQATGNALQTTATIDTLATNNVQLVVRGAGK